MPEPQPQPFADPAGPPTVPCERCGVPCRVVGPKHPDARILKYAATPKGVCVTCSATSFFRLAEPVCSLIEAAGGPECLRLEHIRDQFARIMAAGNADAAPDEIDWDRLIANWDLPIPGASGGGRRRKKG